jgi:hypothetical protein
VCGKFREIMEFLDILHSNFGETNLVDVKPISLSHFH